MTFLVRDARHKRTCTVTRPPATGESGITTVAANLPCSNPWPAGKEAREIPDLATIVELYEMTTNTATYLNDDTLTMDDDSIQFKVKRAMKWESSSPTRPAFYFLILEKVSHD